jgi:hypothetical protein
MSSMEHVFTSVAEIKSRLVHSPTTQREDPQASIVYSSHLHGCAYHYTLYYYMSGMHSMYSTMYSNDICSKSIIYYQIDAMCSEAKRIHALVTANASIR